MNKKVLLVEADNQIQKFLKNLLVENYFEVDHISKGAELLNYLKNHSPDLLIIDIDLKDLQCDRLCRKITRLYPDLPIVLITPHTEDVAHLTKFFNMGIEDYVKKPINTDDLITRVRARMEALQPENGNLELGKLKIDDLEKKVTINDKQIDLSPLEYNLLKYLVINKDRVVSRDMILNHVWDDKELVNPRNVDVYIGYLRKKLKNEKDDEVIQTVRGFGYRIKAV